MGKNIDPRLVCMSNSDVVFGTGGANARASSHGARRRCHGVQLCIAGDVQASSVSEVLLLRQLPSFIYGCRAMERPCQSCRERHVLEPRVRLHSVRTCANGLGHCCRWDTVDLGPIFPVGGLWTYVSQTSRIIEASPTI